METGFDIVVTLVRDGPAAAWDKIKEQLSNLKDMVIGGITDFVVDMVVKKAIPKLIAMFIPGAGFISAILSIYDTIMVFVNKIKQIIQVVTGFIDSIVAIAAGQIGAAAARVEGSARRRAVARHQLPRRLRRTREGGGQGHGVIQKIRAPIDKALDWLVNFIVKGAKSLFAKGKAAVSKLLNWAFSRVGFKDADGKQHTILVNEAGLLTVQSQPMAALEFVDWYVKEKKGDAAIAAEAKKLIAQAPPIIKAIQAAEASGEKPPAPDKQRELLALNTKISEQLSKLVGRKDLGKAEQKYLLEGQIGTYATIPKPVGDQLTADHQPQASVIQAAGDFFEWMNIDGGKLAERAKNRAHQGYAINLHFRRHVAGATYGSKGETRAGFLEKLKTAAGKKKPNEAKTKVVEMLQTETKKDVAQMKKVAKFALKDDAWHQLVDETGGEEPAKKLQGEIAGRIDKGEDQIAAQPFDF